MAFFDEIGNKITRVGQQTIQKTKDFSESARINGQITEEEKNLDNTYRLIGKLYIQLHGGDSEAEFAELMQSVAESENKIGSLREQLKILKGVSVCQNCGAEVPRMAAFCSECGARVLKAEPVDFVICPNCGAKTKPGMNFCTTCGGRLEVRTAELNINIGMSGGNNGEE